MKFVKKKTLKSLKRRDSIDMLNAVQMFQIKTILKNKLKINLNTINNE
jgi:hypothetical protein